MGKVIDFQALKNKKESKEINKSKENKIKAINKDGYSFDIVKDYDSNQIYIDVYQMEYNLDVSVNLEVNLSILMGTISRNPMTVIDKNFIKSVTNLDDESVIGIYEVYKYFEFINIESNMFRSIQDVKESYIKIRKDIGYPENKELFEEIITLEKEIFSKFTNVNEFNGIILK